MDRKSLLAVLCLLGGSILIGLGWWDHWNSNQINQWWAGERLYPFYWNRLILTLAIALPLALLAWGLGLALRAGPEDTPLAQRGRGAAWGFAAAFAIPFILLLKYRVTWLGINYGSSVWTYGLVLVLSIVITWLLWPALRNQRLLKWLEHQGPIIVLTAMMIYVLVYGGLSIARHVSFRTRALHLGTVDQAVWNTSRGRLLEYTPLPLTFDEAKPDLSPDSRLADDKLELILLPLSLLYWLWADPRLLIALQAILLAGGAIPLFQLARDCLEDGPAALIISLAYLLYLPLHYIISAGFHTSALMVPFLLWAWQAAQQGYWRSYYVALVIALFCRVDAAPALLGMGVYFFLKRPYGLEDGRRRRHGVVTLLISLAWMALGLGLISPWARAVYGAGRNGLLLERYGQFGQGVMGIAWGLLTHPLDALRVIFDREKLQTLVDLVATLGWMPFLGPLALLPAVPVLILNLLAASSFRSSVLVHHFAPVIPFLFIAAVWGAANVGRWISHLSDDQGQPRLSSIEGSRLVAFYALITTLLATLLFSPLPPGWKFRLTNYYQAGEHERALARTLDVVPADVVVSAQNNLFSHLSQRPVVYLFPTVADADYVVVDLEYSASKTPIDESVFDPAVDGILADPSFHVVTFDNGALLLQRGPGQAPPAFAENLADYSAGLYRSALVEYRGPTRLRAEDMYQATVMLENRGTQSWETVGSYPIYVSYHWWTPDGSLVEWNGLRTSLRKTVQPDDALSQSVRFVSPTRPGDYVLEWDLVHEGRAWFSERGGITLSVDVTVE